MSLAVGAPAHGAAADPVCPANDCFTVVGEDHVAQSTAAVTFALDSHSVLNLAHLDFDMAAGVANARASGNALGLAEIDGHDRYTIGGVPAGTPVSFIARLHGSGSVSAQCASTAPCATGSFVVKIQAPGSPQILWSMTDRQHEASGDADLALTVNAGDPFDLTLMTTAQAYSPTTLFAANVSGRSELQFVGLPPGAYVSSCKGYLSAPVATLRDSWGELKIRYR